MQSSGTSTPAGDSPGPGRAFLRTTDFTPEIVPPRLRRTTYPAGQSPLVLPGLTRASSSFTITSNHQNILPLWPAAPPPGQPVVFFCPLSGVRPACLSFLRRHGLSKVGRGGAAPYRGPCGPLCRARDREEDFSPSESRSSRARQLSGLSGHGAPAIREERPSCAALCDAPAVRQALAGPVSPPCSVRTLTALGQDARAARPSQMARRTSARRNSPFLSSSSFFLIMETPSAVRLLCGRGAARLTRAASPAVIRRHKKRRPPAWRPADVWSRFTDAARGIRTACRAGKRWPRNRRLARRHCSTGHGSGSWPGSCARRTWA